MLINKNTNKMKWDIFKPKKMNKISSLKFKLFKLKFWKIKHSKRS